MLQDKYESKMGSNMRNLSSPEIPWKMLHNIYLPDPTHLAHGPRELSIFGFGGRARLASRV